MRFLLSSMILCSLLIQGAFGQEIPSPESFLGYPLGSHFTPHYKVVGYFEKVAAIAPNVKLQHYGETYEGRPLIIATITSSQNYSQLEEIRGNNLSLSNGNEANTKLPPVVWLSYNVHGNEAVSSEAAMKTLYALLQAPYAKLLDNTVVVIDPCLNPDGRERYINFYNSNVGKKYDATRFAREHREPWPGGRSNHYYFDLNRDWAWQTQVESKERLKVYHEWMPQVHVDFHEQGIDNPYYFAPAAEPFHEVITPWQRSFQVTIGKNNARYFDENGWLYFTKEVFDLFYPSYGDTYPLYNGAIGMTYEQGGSGAAGLAVMKSDGDTLTLESRIEHHFTTGIATIETTSLHAREVMNAYRDYYQQALKQPAGQFKSYVVKGKDHPQRLAALATLLRNNKIDFGYGSDVQRVNGWNYLTGKSNAVTVSGEDMVISAYQPHSTLLQVLFEPKSHLSDSVTYDITAWALPYAYGLETYGLKQDIRPANKELPQANVEDITAGKYYAYVSPWLGMNNVKFLSRLLQEGIKVRYAEVPFVANNRTFPAGSLIITRAGNHHINRFDAIIQAGAKDCNIELVPVNTGFVDKGADFGSSKIRYIKPPKVALLAGKGVSSLGMGEVWHLFDQQFDYPLTVVNQEDLTSIDLSKLDVLILADGRYNFISLKESADKLKDWVRNGGKLIVMDGAAQQLGTGDWGFKLKSGKDNEEKEKDEKAVVPELTAYAERERESVKDFIPGAIYRVDIDNTHPLAFGYGTTYFTLKQNDQVFEWMKDGWNVGVIRDDNYLSGFVGATLKDKLKQGMLLGAKELGAGQVIIFADDPIFRSFWENGKLLFANAVFLVGE
ncbi:zinc carboxypeptidase [Chitinophaga caeni]|uniref:Zinc carboxypeptidase n=1 Tax=Chitinophaga caeni TaxID=2029983 RepID=A0A291QVZ2_9BACT|nr:M14 family metallopeptidase [Chitinophaga caeni]ATL48100.1 zinc carboxypeptidase [Chitinophaga caeni]